MTTLTIASSDRHLQGILDLQRRYLARTSPPEQQALEGFVFVEHTLPLLRRMAASSPQAIALSGERVVGYCLSLHLSLQGEVPSLGPMFEQFGRCVYRQRPLRDYRFIVGGQTCVDRDQRGQGLMARLYDEVRVSLPFPCDLCVTEVATRNRPSMRAHERMGFEPVATYSDGREEWVVVAWDLSRPAVAAPGGEPPGGG
ncbi:MAG TPA: GNAT family N-acetyltransferase [Gemmatimonadales bacterium]|nr:GNAT family N-acetyltransferase [Gemmatimonadales bacterium]